MLKKINTIVALAFFLLLPLAVQADNFWQEKIPVNSSDFVLTQDDFTAFSVHIPKNTQIFAQTEQDPRWKIINPEEDETSLSNLYFVPKGSAKKIRLRIDGNAPASLDVDFYNTSDEENPVLVASNSKMIGNLNIISRAGWGADESFRFTDDEKSSGSGISDKEPESSAENRAAECGVIKGVHPEEFEINYTKAKENGYTLRWTYQYSKRIFKVVIHHTAENGVKEGRSATEVMRGIYAYHANSKSWGDIGYHFVIAPDGKIYEGRAGGNYVVGGHAYCNNIGTIGISLMGNFEESEPSEKQIQALGKLLPQLASVYELDLTATESFHGKTLKNLVGHRDLRATACPGKNMYSLIPDIIEALANSSEIRYVKSFLYATEYASPIEIIKMKAGTKKTITLRFKNTGNVEWDHDTWLYVFQPKTGGISVNSPVDRIYVAAKMKEGRVYPGQIATFEVKLETAYRGGLFTLEFSPVVNNKKITSGSIIQPIEVEQPDWGATMYKTNFNPTNPFPLKRVSASAKIRNTGNTVWKKDYITLSIFSGKGREKLEVSLKENIAPNKIATFNFSLDPYAESGKKTILMRLLLSGGGQRGLPSFSKILNIEDAHVSAEALQGRKIISYIEKGETAYQSFKFKNTGNITWNKNDVFLDIYSKKGKETISMSQNKTEPDDNAIFNYSLKAKRVGGYKFATILRASKKKISETGTYIVVAMDNVPEKLKNMGNIEISRNKASEKNINKITEDDIRIRLSFPENNAIISASGNMDIYADNKKITTIKKGETVEIKKYNSKIFLSSTAKEYSVIRFVPQGNAILKLENWNHQPAWDTSGKINDNLFQNILEARIYNDNFVIINELDIEEYLKGMAEVSASTHFEKMKTMAVLIRTYALFYMQEENEKWAGAPYDGSDSPAEFQKYLGYNFISRSGEWSRAVEETSELVVKYSGELIKTPYFHQSDGRTRSANEVWGWGNTPYLKSVNDPYCTDLALDGHGVGLSGVGAEKSAENGKAFKEIIKYYYTGVKIEQY